VIAFCEKHVEIFSRYEKKGNDCRQQMAKHVTDDTLWNTVTAEEPQPVEFVDRVRKIDLTPVDHGSREDIQIIDQSFRLSCCVPVGREVNGISRIIIIKPHES